MNHCRKHGNSLHWCSTKCSGGGGGGGGGGGSSSHGSDPARIHQGCGPDFDTYPEYVDGTWQCTDGVWGPYDNAAIHSECNVGVHYSSETSSWYCKDDGPNGLNSVDWQFYVQRGCQNGAGWSSDSNNAHGEGWYCNDDVDVSDYNDSFYENGFVRVGCPGDIHFDDNLGAWYCDSQVLLYRVVGVPDSLCRMNVA